MPVWAAANRQGLGFVTALAVRLMLGSGLIVPPHCLPCTGPPVCPSTSQLGVQITDTSGLASPHVGRTLCPQDLP